jgi:hypothetical protein
MDIYKAIQELRNEKKRLDRAIAALEEGGEAADERPQRRAWNADARRAAGERMKKYWEQRKQEQDAKAPSAGYSVNPPSTDSA